MRIKMTDGTSIMEWNMVPIGNVIFARQVDKTGSHRVPFDSPDLAGAWILAQVEFYRDEMDFKFINV